MELFQKCECEYSVWSEVSVVGSEALPQTEEPLPSDELGENILGRRRGRKGRGGEGREGIRREVGKIVKVEGEDRCTL